jgi:hypothetical protein
MPQYPSAHYDKPATYVAMTTTPRRAYTLMHYEEPISPTMPTASACLHVAATRRLEAHDRIWNADRNLWVPMANILYMERQDRNVY